MPKKKITKGFVITLKIAGEEYQGMGNSILEAINALHLELGKVWIKIKLKGTLIVTDGTKTCEHTFFKKQLRLIFANNITKEMWAQRLGLLLNAK